MVMVMTTMAVTDRIRTRAGKMLGTAWYYMKIENWNYMVRN